MLKLLRLIIKALAPLPTEQEQRQAQNKEQVKLIIQGLENRGY